MASRIEVDVEVFRALSLLSRKLTSAVEQRLRKSAGVSLPEFDVLSALDASPDRRARAGELGGRVAWEKSRISHQVARMERKGLISRVSCVDDQRGTWVALTEKGASAIAAAMPAYEAAVRAELEEIALTDSGSVLTVNMLALGTIVAPEAWRDSVAQLLSSLPFRRSA